MSEWVYASGRLLRPVCRFCIGTLLRGQVFSPLPERARKERRLLRLAEGGLPFSAFAAVGSVRPVRTVPENGRHILCRTRPSSALFAVFPPGPFFGEGFLPRKLQYRGYCLTLFTSPAVPARWYCFSLRGEKRHAKSMVYTAVYNYKLYFIIIRMIYCVFLPPVTDRMREVSVRDCRGRSDTRVSPVTCAERYGY